MLGADVFMHVLDADMFMDIFDADMLMHKSDAGILNILCGVFVVCVLCGFGNVVCAGFSLCYVKLFCMFWWALLCARLGL